MYPENFPYMNKNKRFNNRSLFTPSGKRKKVVGHPGYLPDELIRAIKKLKRIKAELQRMKQLTGEQRLDKSEKIAHFEMLERKYTKIINSFNGK